MAKSLNVLIVDDNRSAAEALARVLRKQGDHVDAVYDGASAIEQIRLKPPDLVLTDLKMEPVDGMQVLAAARELRPPVEVIVFTAFGAVEVAVKAMHLGARDFLTKPVTVDQVAQRLDALRAEHPDAQVAEIVATPVAVPAQNAGAAPFVARSPTGLELHNQLVRAAGVPSPVWIQGELGAGRGFAASTLHQLGPHPEAPYVVRDLGRPDLPWPAAGTVVLPNVDDLPDDLQRALVRSLATVPREVRLVTTASNDGRRLISEGRIRPELYYALAVVVVQVPALRHRPDDVLPLFEQSMEEFAARYGRPRPVVPADAAERLIRHAWPGNVRELSNLAERAVVMGASAFEFEIQEGSADGMPKLEPGFDLAVYLDAVERRILTEALRKAGGDRNRAGRLLGVERNTLRYKLNKYGLLDR